MIKNIVLGYLSFAKVEATEILIKEDPDPNERLMGQFFAALLNTLNGADSSTIDLILVNTRIWLILYPHGVDLTEPEILEIEAYADQLQEYNTSLIGPGLCSDEPMTPIPTAIFTPQASDTSSSGPTVPFRIPTPTKKPGGSGKPKPTLPPANPPNLHHHHRPTHQNLLPRQRQWFLQHMHRHNLHRRPKIVFLEDFNIIAIFVTAHINSHKREISKKESS